MSFSEVLGEFLGELLGGSLGARRAAYSKCLIKGTPPPFFFNDTATTESYTILFVGSVRCVYETAPVRT